MSILSENIRYLRGQLGVSQQKVADDLLITRGRYAKYEDEASEPPIELLLKISRYFHASIDLLVSIDLRKYPLKEIMELPDNRIVFPVSVDRSGEPIIEIIPHKASMGYLNGYSDPEYIESLPSISLPFLGQGKYRAFPVEGDSMPPHKDSSFIIGRFIERVQDMKEGKSYVLLTRNGGITFKRLEYIGDNRLSVQADNPIYQPYTIPLEEIYEIWQYACSIATEEFSPDDFSLDHHMILRMFQELKKELQDLKAK